MSGFEGLLLRIARELEVAWGRVGLRGRLGAVITTRAAAAMSPALMARFWSVVPVVMMDVDVCHFYEGAAAMPMTLQQQILCFRVMRVLLALATGVMTVLARRHGYKLQMMLRTREIMLGQTQAQKVVFYVDAGSRVLTEACSSHEPKIERLETTYSGRTTCKEGYKGIESSRYSCDTSHAPQNGLFVLTLGMVSRGRGCNT
jgi:hypothetical protein